MPLPILVIVLLLAACDSADSGPVTSAGAMGTPVTIVTASKRRVEVLERSVGRLETPSAPAVAAETAGRVEAVLVDAGHEVEAGDLLAELNKEVQRNTQRAAEANVQRLEALVENQQRTVVRNEDMVGRNLTAESVLDEATSQLAALTAQLNEARANLDDAERNLRQTRILSPVSGMIQARRVSVGDFVAVGQPLFDIVSADLLQAIAPFPEMVADRLKIGQDVQVAPVRGPEESIGATITELRPRIASGSRSMDVIIEFDNPDGWRAGASVTVDVVVEARDHSVTVPPESIVRRPAGVIVYVAENGTARQRPVKVGVQAADWVEILEGLSAGTPVVASGAGFLTDGTAISAKKDVP